MKWSEEFNPNKKIPYNHVLLKTPLGEFSIEWKGWKDNDSRCINLNGEWLNSSNYDLESAKEWVKGYIYKKTYDLIEFIENGTLHGEDCECCSGEDIKRFENGEL